MTVPNEDDLAAFIHPTKGFVDLTTDGILRAASTPAGKKAIKKNEPRLEYYLPRRKTGIRESSFGTDIRIKLLPFNKNFEERVTELRGLLRIQPGHMNEADCFEEKGDVSRVSAVIPVRGRPRHIAGQAAGSWLQLHRGLAMDAEALPLLAPWLIDSAVSSRGVLAAPTTPEWWHRTPRVPPRFAARFTPGVDVESAVALLIEAFELPWTADKQLLFYVLTEDTHYLERIRPLSVAVGDVQSLIGEAIKVSVDGIDEFTTPEMWSRIFVEYLRPRQDELWQQRADTAKGKRPFGNLDRDLGWLRERRTGKSYKEILDAWNSDHPDQDTLLRDATVGEAIHRLKAWMKPCF